MLPGAPSTLRKALENGLERLLPELETLFHSEADARAETALAAAAEHLNQAVRRLRDAGGFPAAAAVLLDASAAFCNAAAVFRVSGDNEITAECIRGVDQPRAERFGALKFPAGSASAFGMAVEGGDPVVSLAAPGDVSAALAELLAHPEGERVALFPVKAAGDAVGVLYCWGEPQIAALELLAQAAGMALGQARPAQLIGIAPAAPVKPADREIHLRAQRFARVQVAEMRLYRPDAVSAGRARRDLYGALGDAIDEARETFRRQFLTPSPGMTDYLHEELLRTLANGDPAMLGEKYPGPLA